LVRHLLTDIGGFIFSVLKPTVGLPLWIIAKNISLRCNREQEKQADITGMRIACTAGYDPWGAILFYEKLSQLNRYTINLFKTHPSSRERLKRLISEAANVIANRSNVYPVFIVCTLLTITQ
jgi:predicted Zn-dependent protease